MNLLRKSSSTWSPKLNSSDSNSNNGWVFVRRRHLGCDVRKCGKCVWTLLQTMLLSRKPHKCPIISTLNNYVALSSLLFTMNLRFSTPLNHNIVTMQIRCVTKCRRSNLMDKNRILRWEWSINNGKKWVLNKMESILKLVQLMVPVTRVDFAKFHEKQTRILIFVL